MTRLEGDRPPVGARPAGRLDVAGPGVLVARDFHLGSVIHIATEDGPVVVDTTGGAGSAAAARDALAERNGGAARWLIYTHCHPDHCGGAGAFESDQLEGVVAQDQLPDLWERDMSCLWPWHERVRAWQRGRPKEAGLGYDEPGGRQFLPPTLTFRDTLDLEVGGTHIHLEHTEGETRDHLLVWLPDRKVLCPGDLYYAAFPNLSTPAIGPRPIEGWIRSLDRMLELGAEHLVPSHTRPISGADAVRTVLTDYRDAIDHIWTATHQALNDGLDADTAAATIRLPDRLASQPFLQERYGTVAWGVRAAYDRLTGWFDGTPATLNPLPRHHRHAEIVEIAGGDALVARAQARHDEGRHQLALELASIVVDADPHHEAANRITISACKALAAEATSINEVGFYISGARLARHRLETTPDSEHTTES
jgi:alkyl sulfatase BDS1-like metallo-beta-lactamase superfamily hydrolase